MRRKYITKKYFCFGSELEKAREWGGFSLKAVGKICGRSARTVKDWETGKQPCPRWALRLVELESRYMDALYGLQRDRAAGWIFEYGTWAANNDTFSTQMPLSLVV